MDIRKVKIADIHPADYNPRRELTPDDPEYAKIKRSLQTFGAVEPIVINKRTGNIISGHQRYRVIKDEGKVEIDAVLLDLNDRDEKELNVALNKIKGDWDYLKLNELLQGLSGETELELTGFDIEELNNLTVTDVDFDCDSIAGLFSEDSFGFDRDEEKETFFITFIFPEDKKEVIENYLEARKDAKEVIAERLTQLVTGE